MWSGALGALGDDHLDHSHRSAAIRILFVYSCRTGRPPSASCSASKASGLRSHCGRSLVRFNRQPIANRRHRVGRGYTDTIASFDSAVVWKPPDAGFKPYHFQCSRIRYKLRSKPVDLRIMHL